MFKYILLIVALGFLAALLQYITGRIILPEMSLTAPSYGAWLAVTFFIELPVMVVNEVIRQASRPRFGRW